MRRRQRFGIFAVVGSGLLVLGACGGGEEGPTKAEFIRAADDVCDKADEKLDKIQEREVEDFADLKKMGTDAVKVAEAAMTDLRALEVPEGDEEAVEEVFGGLEKQIRTLRQVSKAAEDEDEDRINELVEEGEDIDAENQEAAEAYGFKSCAIDDEEDEEEPIGNGGQAEDEEEVSDPEEEDTAGGGLPAGSLELEEVEAALAEEVSFVEQGPASLVEDSTPAPRDALAYETEDGSVVFEILTYDSPADMQKAKSGVIAGAGCIEDEATCTSGRNVILVLAGDSSTISQIGVVFTERVLVG